MKLKTLSNLEECKPGHPQGHHRRIAPPLRRFPFQVESNRTPLQIDIQGRPFDHHQQRFRNVDRPNRLVHLMGTVPMYSHPSFHCGHALRHFDAIPKARCQDIFSDQSQPALHSSDKAISHSELNFFALQLAQGQIAAHPARQPLCVRRPRFWLPFLGYGLAQR